MLLQRASWLSPKFGRFFCCVLVLTHVPILEAFVFCSKEIFGCPKYRDCMDALSALLTSRFVQFFVEQQLRADFREQTGPHSSILGPLDARNKLCSYLSCGITVSLSEMPWHWPHPLSYLE